MGYNQRIRKKQRNKILIEGRIVSNNKFKEVSEHNRFHSFKYRTPYVRNVSWSIVTKETIANLKNIIGEGRCIDVCAGSGHLAKHLKKAGVKIEAVDKLENWYFKHNPARGFVRKVKCGISEIKPYHDFVIMSWPEYNTPFAAEVANKLLPGQKLLYCGENYGCNGNDEFFEILRDQFTEIEEGLIEQLADGHIRWHGIHDHWQLYVKN